MDPELLFKMGISFYDFVNKDDDSYKEKTLEVYNNINFSEELLGRVKSIDKKINILICAETWCPDCMINVPVVEKMRDLNKHIHISIVGKEENVDFFKKYSLNEIIKIPTFLFFDEKFNLLGSFIERPQYVKEVANSGNQPAVIVTMRKYRKGEYTEETLKDILKIIGQ